MRERRVYPLVAVVELGVLLLVGVLVGVGRLDTSMAVALIGGTVVLVVGYRYPEVPLALFLTAGAFKAALPQIVDLSVAFGAAVGLLAIVYLLRYGPPQSLPRPLLLFGGLILLMGLGVIYTPAPEYAMDKLLRFAVLGGITVFGSWVLIRDRWGVRRLMLALTAVGVALSIQALIAGGSAAAYGRFVTAGSGTIWLGRAAALGVLALVAYVANGKARSSLWIVAGGAVSVIALVGAGARGPAAAVLAAIGVLFIVRMTSGGRSTASIVAAAVVVAALVMISLQFAPATSLVRFTRIVSNNPGESALARVTLASEGIRLILKSPFTGVGTAGFAAYSATYVYPHNLLIELWAENGIASVVMAVVLLASALRNSWLASMRHRSVEMDWILLMLVSGIMNSLVSSDVNGNRLLYTAIVLGVQALTFARNDLRTFRVGEVR